MANERTPEQLIRSLLSPIFNEVDMGIALLDSQGHPQWVNKTYETWFSSETDIIALASEGVYQNKLTFMDQVKTSQQNICSEFSYKNQDGLIQNYQLTAYPVNDFSSEQYSFIILVKETTEIKQAAKIIQHKEAHFQTALDLTPTGIILTDLNGRFTYANQETAQVFGYANPIDVIKTANLENFIKFDHRKIDETLNLLNQENQTKGIRTQMKKKDGTPILVNIQAAALRDSAGQPYQFLITLQDITEKAQAEKTQEAIYKIASAAGSPARLENIYPTIHEIIKGIMPANNFYIALYDSQNDTISFPYFVDEKDDPPPLLLLIDQKSITAYVLRTARSLLCTLDVSTELKARGEVELVGSEPATWLGAPLIIEGETIGVIAVQHYDDPHAYTLKEQRILEFVSTEVAKAIHSKRTEEALHESEKRFRTIVESSPFGMHLYRLMPDDNLVFIAANESADQIIGGDRSQFIGKNLTDSFPTLKGSEIPAAFSKVAAEGDTWQHRRISTDKNGILRGVNIFAFQTSPNEVAVFIQDITESLQTDQALIESEKRFRSVVESSPMGIVIYQLNENNDLLFTDSNQAAEEILGIDSQVCIGSRLEDIFPDLSDTDIPSTYRKIASSGGVYHGRRIRQKEEKISSAFEVFVFQISHSQVAVIYQDITNRLKNEEEIKRLNEELEERVALRTAELEAANREMEAFAYSVSHDLRAPIRSIKGFSEILLEGFQTFPAQDTQELLERIYNSSIKMDQLIDDLLSLSYLENQDLEIQTIDLSQIVRNIATQISNEYSTKRFTLKIEDTPTTRADLNMVQIMLTNLITNAFKFTADNDKPKISFGSLKTQNETTYYLKDNGIGFDMEYAEKIFSPFARLHSTEYEGTGIGLAIVRRVIQRHKGRIWASSELGKGTTFYFSFGTHQDIT